MQEYTVELQAMSLENGVEAVHRWLRYQVDYASSKLLLRAFKPRVFKRLLERTERKI